MKHFKLFYFIFFITLPIPLFTWQPNFLIIGAQKGGTTSLYYYLTKHPQVISAKWKEVHFFNNYRGQNNFLKGMAWYKKRFHASQKNKILGEATPEYLFFPFVPERVYSLFPNIKIIVLLRNPTKRAISYYRHNKDRKLEPLELEDALAAEEDRLYGEKEKIQHNPNYYSYNYERFSYKARGVYINQIKNWRKYFPKEQFLILKSEDFFADPDKTLTHVYNFLNIKNIPLANYPHYGQNNYSAPVSPETIQRLNNYFKPYNEELRRYLLTEFDIDITW